MLRVKIYMCQTHALIPRLRRGAGHAEKGGSCTLVPPKRWLAWTTVTQAPCSGMGPERRDKGATLAVLGGPEFRLGWSKYLRSPLLKKLALTKQGCFSVPAGVKLRRGFTNHKGQYCSR